MRLAFRFRGVIAVWQRLRDAVSQFLVIVGFCAIGYGVAFWWKGLPYRELMLLACVTLGSLPLGLGLVLRTRVSQPVLVLAAVCCTVSGVLQFVLIGFGLLQPIGMILQLLAWGGAGYSYVRLQKLRRSRGP